LQTLRWANFLDPSDQLEVGRSLIVPLRDGLLYGVQRGDTLFEIASNYAVDLHAMLEVNALQAPYTLLIGQLLLLPGAQSSTPREANAPAIQSTRASPSERPEGAAPPAALPPPVGASPAQARFILRAADAARISQKETGVPASVTIAQAILESNWGSSRLAKENDNYFGIKARGKEGTAGVVWYDTWEVVDGENVMQRAAFRAYREVADSFVDHGHFFLENPRYRGALAVRSDPREFARAITRAGYATDPVYAPKLIAYMDRFNLYAYDLTAGLLPAIG
jgi:flagellum-specific peptidoglycan hydrolase FlgJ